jgi:hypothetical protein
VALALVAFGSGGVAVFVTQLEAGPVALLAVGLVLLLIGAGGRLPSRLKVGENEAAWEAVEDFVSRVAEDVPSEQTPQLVDALGELAEAVPSAAAAGLEVVTERLTYQRMVMDLLAEAVNEINDPRLGEPLITGRAVSSADRFDIVIAAQNGPPLALRIRPLRHRIDVKTIESIEADAKESGRILFISNQEITPLAAGRLEGNERLYYVRVTSKEDLPDVVKVIGDAFGIDRTSTRTNSTSR